MLVPSAVQSLVVVTTGIVAVSADSIDNMVDCNIGSQPAPMHMQDCVKATLLGKCSMPASTWKKRKWMEAWSWHVVLSVVVSTIDVLSSNKAKSTYSPPLLSVAAVELALAQGAAAVVVAGFAGTVIVLIRCFIGSIAGRVKSNTGKSLPSSEELK